MPKRTSIAKITRPKTSGIYERQRLYKLLDRSFQQPVTWISSPAGSGKTSLVAGYLDARKLPCLWYQIDRSDSDPASFFYYMGAAAKEAATLRRKPLPLLTPEYLLDVSTFSQRYFESLCSRFRSPFVIVFDNYHEIPPDSPFHEVFLAGLSMVPAGIHVVISSRTDPPPAFSRVLASNALNIIGWNEMRLTAEESRGIVLLHWNDPKKEAVASLHEKTGGWAAGLILLIKTMKPECIDTQALDAVAPKRVFDYFANELFCKINEEGRTFLLKTAVLPRISPFIAEQLTGYRNAEALLSQLNRENYFTEKRERLSYQYHPLFRSFLLSKAGAAFSQKELSDIQRQAAGLLKESGQYEDAAELFMQAGDEPGLTGLIFEHAPMLAGQGRYPILEYWLKSLSPETVSRNGLLLYWIGVCSQPFNPPSARTAFEKAFALFRRKKDLPGQLLAWSGIIDTFIYEWNDFTPLDPWIVWFEKNELRKVRFPAPEIEAKVAASMSAALMVRRPDHPDIGGWWDRALSLSRACGDGSIRLQSLVHAVNYYFWVGDYATGKALVEEVGRLAQTPHASPLVQLTWKWLETAVTIAASVDPDRALNKVADTLAYADATGVHIWDHMICALGAYASLVQGSLSKAQGFITRMEATLDPARRHSRCHYLFLVAWRDLIEGNFIQAENHAKQALDLAEETGYVFPIMLCRFEMAQVLLTLGRHREAEVHNVRAYTLACRSKSPIYQHISLLTKARISFMRGKKVAGLKTLRIALRMGRERGYVALPWWAYHSGITPLFALALEAGIEVEYVQHLIHRHNLIPDVSSSQMESWPWPIKVYTLGRFEIVKNDKPVRFSKKAPKKTLEALKALIAFGGKDIREEQILEALWPDSDGDTARNALNVTLLRLRQLLGVKEALSVSDGAISLDQRRVWADALAFRAAVDRASEAERADKTAESEQFYEQALAYFRGLFLAGEDTPWCYGPRERYRIAFLDAVEKLGWYREKKGQLRKAVEVYSRGISVDELLEKFYLRIMDCLLRLGSRAEALAVYHRLQKICGAYGIEPSPEARIMYTKIVSKRSRNEKNS